MKLGSSLYYLLGRRTRLGRGGRVLFCNSDSQPPLAGVSSQTGLNVQALETIPRGCSTPGQCVECTLMSGSSSCQVGGGAHLASGTASSS